MVWVVFFITWSQDLPNWCERWGGKTSELSLGSLIVTSGQSLQSTKLSHAGIQIGPRWLGLISPLFSLDSYWNNWMLAFPYPNVSFQPFFSILNVNSSSWFLNDLKPGELLMLHSTDPCINFCALKLGKKMPSEYYFWPNVMKSKNFWFSNVCSLPPLCLHSLLTMTCHSLSNAFPSIEISKNFQMLNTTSPAKKSCNILD